MLLMPQPARPSTSVNRAPESRIRVTRRLAMSIPSIYVRAAGTVHDNATERPPGLNMSPGPAFKSQPKESQTRMARLQRLVILVHGWSVRDAATYGEVPERLKREAKRH